MNQEQLNLNDEREIEACETPAPRRLFLRSGLGVAAAAIGGLAAARSAFAQDTMGNEAMETQPLAPGESAMNAAPIGTMSGPGGIPEDGMIMQVENPGAAEANDVAILNYALTLEYLEAEFYTRAVEADTNREFLRGRPKQIARVLQRDETTHVAVVTDAIRKLGGTPVEKPTFQFPGEAFISQVAFLQTSARLEETGVSAYLGQVARVQRRDVLNFAASIYGIEARHTGLIRYYLGDVFAPRDLELALPMEAILERVKPFIVS